MSAHASAAESAHDAHEQSLRDLRRGMTRRIVDYARTGKSSWAEGVVDRDVSFYLDPDLYAREHKKLFRETPLVACLSTELPEPGSYRIFDDTGVPMIVVRGKDGKVRAFLNACPHHGARVVREECGSAARFTCRFHGWTYDTTGKAVAIPEEDTFCNQIGDRKQLVACPAEERHGLVFVQATAGSTMDLDAHLGTFAPELAALGLDRAHSQITDEVHVDSNWKYTLDTYFENYHLPVLHKDTFAKVFANKLTLLDTWGPHMRFIYPHRSITEWMDKPESEWPVDSLPAQHFLFPNTVIVLGSVSKSGSLISIHRLFPTDVGKLTTKIALYAPHGLKSPDHRKEIEASFASIMRAVRDEDYSVTNESYRALASFPPGTKFPIGRQEVGNQHIHSHIEQRLGS
jgi:phenylpropionate dioxygenase-like ring-hydroxylating dioxygenase large terminal subunit